VFTFKSLPASVVLHSAESWKCQMIAAGWPRQAAFVAAGQTSGEIVTCKAGIGGHVADLGVRPDLHQRQPDVSDEAARVGDDQVPIRLEDPHELGKRLCQVGHVAQCERTDDPSTESSGSGNSCSSASWNSPSGTFWREGEHLRRCVDTDDLVAERRQVRGVPARTAGRVESHPHREAVKDFAHDRLLEVEKLIPRLDVERRPPCVAFACGDRRASTPSPSSSAESRGA